MQPVHQRQIVGQSAHQRHGGVGVQIDQTGNQDVVFQYHALGRMETVVGLAGRQQGDDPSFMNSHGMVFEHHVGVDRGNPAGLDQQVDQFGSVIHGETSAVSMWVAC